MEVGQRWSRKNRRAGGRAAHIVASGCTPATPGIVERSKGGLLNIMLIFVTVCVALELTVSEVKTEIMCL